VDFQAHRVGVVPYWHSLALWHGVAGQPYCPKLIELFSPPDVPGVVEPVIEQIAHHETATYSPPLCSNRTGNKKDRYDKIPRMFHEKSRNARRYRQANEPAGVRVVWCGGHPTEVKLTGAVFAQFFDVSSCQGYPTHW